jgi:transcriptional regulator with PAS, ATPase and Fis domain
VSEPGKAAPVLLVAADPGRRRALASRLAPHRDVLEVSPAALGDTARWVDASAALVVLEPGAGLSAAERAALLALPARGALILLVRELPEAELEAALASLRPRQLLQAPWTEAALRFALDQVDPAGRGGRGARPYQRPAPALLGVSQALREVLQQVRQVAPTSVPVLILGETGTGKELVARAIHEQSGRHAAPFVALNCAAIPEHLLEAELFGFRRGAFTGAERTKRGLLEEADGGTLFLDEIGEMPLALQVKLLRVLEVGELRALGATETRAVDVRIVSATHADLAESIERGRFRQDLFYRLNTVTLYLPPLRRRRVDIPFLAQHFAEEFGTAEARRITLSEDFLDALAHYDFPGNVRELRNAVERAIALTAPGEQPSERELPPEIRRVPRLLAMGTLRDRLLEVERHAICDALERHAGNRTRVARELGLSRVGLRQKMRRLGIADRGRP